MLFWQINDTIAGNNIFLSETAASEYTRRRCKGQCNRAALKGSSAAEEFD
jgi:hypothetical protein